MEVRFRFEQAGKNRFGPIYRPVAQVSFQSPNIDLWMHVWMVVDTGADYTLLPRYLASKMRISLETDCVKESTFGVGGEQTMYFVKEKVKAKIGKFERRVPLAFLDSNEVPPLLGRLGFLETFDVSFLKTHVVVFKP